jgi:hypothetical protein
VIEERANVNKMIVRSSTMGSEPFELKARTFCKTFALI